MAKKKVSKAAESILIPEVSMQEFIVPIVGMDGPLVVHSWNKKAIAEMLGKQVGAAKIKGRAAKNPEEEYEQSMYRIDGGGYGFPACGFKSAIVSAANEIEGLPMTRVRKSVFVIPDAEENREFEFEFDFPAGDGKVERRVLRHNMNTQLVRIEGEPRMRMDMVRVGGISRTADIRFRAEFPQWRAKLHIRHLPVLKTKEILNLIILAGVTIGIGEGRAERKTDLGWGKFTVDTSVKTVTSIKGKKK